MSGSKAGYQKAHQKLLERYGGPEGLRKHREEIGHKGGKISRGGGFAKMDPVKHQAASAKGGRATVEFYRRTRIDNDKEDVVES
jgi:general stress protein YciG